MSGNDALEPEILRDGTGMFSKGASGNPGGIPRQKRNSMREVQELAGKLAPEAMQRLGQLVHSKNEKVALGAINAVLDRAIGKPVQAVVSASPESAERHEQLVKLLITLARPRGDDV